MNNYIKVLCVYDTHNGKQLRAKILVESENSCESFIVKITKKNSSVLSFNGYGLEVTGLDLDSQSVSVNFFGNGKKIPSRLTKTTTLVLF